MAKPKKTSINKNTFFLPLSLTLIIMALGFGFLIYTVGKTRVDQNEDTQKVEYVENKLSNEFPKDFPVYPNSTIASSWRSQDEDTIGVSAIFETHDVYKDVVTYYSKNLPQHGWTVTDEIGKDNGYIASFKKDGSEGFIGITQSADIITLSVTISRKN